MPPAKKEEKVKFKFNGKNWTIRFVKSKDMPGSFGECDDHRYKKPEIWINRNLSEKDKLDTIIHEMLHATHPELSEESVSETASAIAKILFRLNLRFISKD
jgi:hypothetical protein